LLIQRFEKILNEVDNVKRLADDFSHPDSGLLSIATTHTQARYVMPPIINEFRKRYPNVQLQINQGTPEQIASLTDTGKADIGIATEALELFENLILLPCYRWNRCLMVPKGHPLVNEAMLTLEKISKYPIITYTFGVADRSVINRAFLKQDLDLNVVLTKKDNDLVMLDTGHLFDSSVTSLAIRKNAVLRAYVYEFISIFASHLNKEVINKALKAHGDTSLQDKLYQEFVKEAAMR